MTRSRAITRLRQERRQANQQLDATRASWHHARRENARSRDLGFLANHELREQQRLTALTLLWTQLDAFARSQSENRLAQDGERARCLEELVTAVNAMIAGFAQASGNRGAEIAALSERVRAFLLGCRATRSDHKTAMEARLGAFRVKVSSDAYKACTDDFR